MQDGHFLSRVLECREFQRFAYKWNITTLKIGESRKSIRVGKQYEKYEKNTY